MLLATDGLRELRNDRDKDFIWAKPADVWQHCRVSSGEETLDLLFAGMKELGTGAAQHDDITVVVVKALSTMVLPRPGGGFSRVALR